MEDNHAELKRVLKIMVVDDSEYARKHIAGLLTKNGFNVVGDAGGAEDAFKAIGTQEVNLVILDIVMPRMNGIELTRKVKEKFRKIHFILMSTLKLEHIILEALSAGALDFLQKPFTEQELFDCLFKAGGQVLEESKL